LLVTSNIENFWKLRQLRPRLRKTKSRKKKKEAKRKAAKRRLPKKKERRKLLKKKSILPCRNFPTLQWKASTSYMVRILETSSTRSNLTLS
jgi:hypothetical protein